MYLSVEGVEVGSGVGVGWVWGVGGWLGVVANLLCLNSNK